MDHFSTPTQADWARALPALYFKGNELHGPCPLCRDGVDRFRVMPNGHVFCRTCLKDGTNPERFKELLEAVGFKDRDLPGKQIDTTVNLISRPRKRTTVRNSDTSQDCAALQNPAPGDLSHFVTSPVDFERGEPVRDEPSDASSNIKIEGNRNFDVKTEYPYRDADGAIAHVTHRIDFADGRPKKIWQSKGYEGKRLLYDLPALIAHPERPLFDCRRRKSRRGRARTVAVLVVEHHDQFHGGGQRRAHRLDADAGRRGDDMAGRRPRGSAVRRGLRGAMPGSGRQVRPRRGRVRLGARF